MSSHHEGNEATRSGNTGRTAITFMIGALAGGAVALLTAPRRGSVLRRQIREGTEDAVDRTRTTVGDRASRVAGSVREHRNAFKEAASAAREAYREEMASANGRGSEER